MAGLQKKASANWALSSAAGVGGGKGKAGGGLVFLTLFDVDSQLYIPVTLVGGGAGVGLPVGVSVSTFSPAFFRTAKPLWAEDFNGKAVIAGAGLTVGVGASASWLTFWNVDHDPYWLDIGGVQAGVEAGIAAGIYYGRVSIGGATANNGCVIAPGGDPLCGGSSSGANSSTDRGMSVAN